MEHLVEASMRRGTLTYCACGGGLRARGRGRGTADAIASGPRIGAGGQLAAPLGPGDDELGGPDDGCARAAPALAKFDQSAGLTQTTPSALQFIPGTMLPGWGLTKTTALDQVRLVARFAYPSSILSDASRQYGLSLMEHVEAGQRWGVTGGVPPDAVVALKNGWLPLGSSGWQIDSIRWIAGHGRNYVLAVLAPGHPPHDYRIPATR